MQGFGVDGSHKRMTVAHGLALMRLRNTQYFKATETPRSSETKGGYLQPPLGTLTAEATLELDGIQDLADQIAEIRKASVGNTLTIHVRVELGGDTPPTDEGCESNQRRTVKGIR